MLPPSCAVCASEPATYVCQSCGRTTCRNCFDPQNWTCQDCRRKRVAEIPAAEHAQVYQFGWLSILFLLAFAAIFIGTLLVFLGSAANSTLGSAGGIILIGPIPIIIGNGPYSFDLILLGAVLTIVMIVLFLFLRRRA